MPASSVHCARLPASLVRLAALAALCVLSVALAGCASTPGSVGTAPSDTAARATPGAPATATSAPAPAPARARGLAAGLCDMRLAVTGYDTDDPSAAIREVTEDLNATWVRVDVLWAAVEPAEGQYDQTAVARLDTIAGGLHDAGAKVLLTVRDVPIWASDSSYWDLPPPGGSPGYASYYPMSASALSRFGALAEFLARRYAGRVQGLECWNEPNLWLFLYPQRTQDDPDFAAHTYLGMLEAFSAGVRRAGTGVRVVASATASFGNDNAFGTSPQRFAAYLAEHGAARLFDVLSHHAYTPGASARRAPGDIPDRPWSTITLGNLPTLLRLFPGKPCYITEYGYSTEPSVAFGWFSVTEPQQASYLRQAYAVAARYPRVKLLVWYLVQDQVPTDRPADRGVYTGLLRGDGTRKPSWHAYARMAAGLR